MSLGTFEQMEADWARFAKLGRPPRIALVACCKEKGPKPAPARDLYRGQLFRASLAYAESGIADKVLVLSGRWGLVELDYKLEPYEHKLKSTEHEWFGHMVCRTYLGLDSRFATGWAPEPKQQLAVRDVLHCPGELICLAGADYVDALRPFLPKSITVVEPLAGLQVGERLSWLKARRAA